MISIGHIKRSQFDWLPHGISLKLNIVACLEFEVAYYNVSLQNISHYTREIQKKGYCNFTNTMSVGLSFLFVCKLSLFFEPTTLFFYFAQLQR